MRPKKTAPVTNEEIGEETGETANTRPRYAPTKTQRRKIGASLRIVHNLVQLRNQKYKEFNDRTLVEFLDDGDERLNVFVEPRENCIPPKEDWQSNMPLPTIRNKLKRTLAGFSRAVPEMGAKSYSTAAGVGESDPDRALVSASLVKDSFEQDGKELVENYNTAWELGRAGTVIVYEGYIKRKQNQKEVTDYDLTEGIVKYKNLEVDVEDGCFSYVVPLTEFYPSNYYEPDIQRQNTVMWVRYLDETDFKKEFGRFSNAQFVQPGTCNGEGVSTESKYYKQQNERLEKEKGKIEVARIYMLATDNYVIMANGVLLLDAPMLWKLNGAKAHPFAKGVFELFANTKFFYGNSFPNVTAPLSDALDTTLNTLTDKQWLSMLKPTLVGQPNQDALDSEDDQVFQGRRYNVPDVTQVKQMDIEGVSAGDVQFISIIRQLIEETVPTLPGMVSRGKTTAREIVKVDQGIREEKSDYQQSLADLWRQRSALRLSNIQMNYPQPRTVVTTGANGKDKTEKVYRTYVIENVILDTVTGERGTLAVEFRDVPDSEKNKVAEENSQYEKDMKAKGAPACKKITVPTDWLDNYVHQIAIVDESLLRENRAMEQATILEEISTVAKLFPEIWAVSQEHYYEQLARAYGRNPQTVLSIVKRLKDAKAALAKREKEEAAGTAQVGQGAPEGGAPVPGAAPGAATAPAFFPPAGQPVSAGS